MIDALRALFVIAACAACAPTVDVPIDLNGAKAALFVLREGTQFRAMAADLAVEPRLIPSASQVFVYLFDADLATLGLGPAPDVRTESVCARDELDTSRATRALCVVDGVAAACVEAPHHVVGLARSSGEPCPRWAIESLIAYDFDLEVTEPPDARVGGALLSVALSPTRVLVGQVILSFDAMGREKARATELRVIDTVPTTTNSLPIASLAGRLPQTMRPGAPRDDHSAWLGDATGRVGLLDVRTGAYEVKVQFAATSTGARLVSLVRAPDDPDMLLAVTNQCAIVRRDGAHWKFLTAPIQQVLSGDDECRGQIEWTRSDEAIAVGAVDGDRAFNTSQLLAGRREVFRIRGDVVTSETLPWPADLTSGVLLAISAYTASDGTRVEVATGSGRPSFTPVDVIGGVPGVREKLWFVRDPRRGGRWEVIVDPEKMATDAIRALLPWRDGVVGVGGYTQAFSDAHLAIHLTDAISLRDNTSSIGRVFSNIASDGHGGYIAGLGIAETSAMSTGRFSWRQPRR